MPKRFEALSELVPDARKISLLVNPTSPNRGRIIGDMQKPALARVQHRIMGPENEIERAFATHAQNATWGHDYRHRYVLRQQA